jgi:putative selenate reductase molybdopterin-binding subunit
MKIAFTLNGTLQEIEISPNQTLLSVLRNQLGMFSVKHGCETGECGACTVLLNGTPANACVMLAPQIQGASIETIELLGEHPDQGWRKSSGLHPLQTAFVETGAIQCGFCTPAMILAANALLRKNPSPNEREVREALSGVLCRCTGYEKPVQAILRAAAVLRGEEVDPISGLIPLPPDLLPQLEGQELGLDSV